jgi:hypothetical protein
MINYWGEPEENPSKTQLVAQIGNDRSGDAYFIFRVIRDFKVWIRAADRPCLKVGERKQSRSKASAVAWTCTHPQQIQPARECAGIVGEMGTILQR